MRNTAGWVGGNKTIGSKGMNREGGQLQFKHNFKEKDIHFVHSISVKIILLIALTIDTPLDMIDI